MKIKLKISVTKSKQIILKQIKHIKKVFEEIYKFRKWTNSGDGSGIGSSIDYIENARNITLK